MKMWIYIIRRVLLLLPVIIGVMTITFVLVSAIPIPAKLLVSLGPTRAPGGYSPTLPAGTPTGCTSDCVCPPTAGPNGCPNPVYVRGVHSLGLDQPLPAQWARYIYDSLTLNWGNTDPKSLASTDAGITTSYPVITVLSWYLPYTLELAALSLFIILVLAIPIGNYSAVYRNRPFDQGARVLSFSGFAFPGFLLAVLVLFAAAIASGGLGTTYCGGQSTSFEQWSGSWPMNTCLIGQTLPPWIATHGGMATSPTGFPTIDAVYHAFTDTKSAYVLSAPQTYGALGISTSQIRAQDWFLAEESIRRIILPALVIAFGSIAGILRFVRNSMLEVMNLDFVRTARAKGVPESRVISYHAGRNSLNVTITVLGLVFAGFIGGFPVYEDVFHINGIGALLVNSVNVANGADYGLIFGATLLFTFIVVCANIIVDVLYAYLDPRVRLG